MKNIQNDFETNQNKMLVKFGVIGKSN